ncbi:MAG TPA: MBOAT family O-acyltransferase [Acetobacteraceae bacterium]|nr:MBOAT family O-acyltransferase [Acetobacteraceae bacterium]
MLFYEPLFLFVFFPTFYLIYLLGEQREGLRLGVILGASVLFYTWSEPLFVPVVLASALADHLIARRIDHLPRPSRQAKLLLAIGVLINLGILAHYKYTRFLIGNLNGLLHGIAVGPIPVPAIILPIGVSFIVFEKITYLVDIYRAISRPAQRFVTYLLYVFFFPKLLAGPIIKYHEMESQLRALPAARFEDISVGFLRFMMGVAKKTLIADTLANGADQIFEVDPAGIGFSHAWIGVLCFTFQIYFDFSGYSDMAIGIARMLGFHLRENFDMPYISCSITEFWRRWHISLTTWIREYLYIPLGGNRVPPARVYVNLWICFLASGLWHGAAWTYVVWGAFNGLFLMLDRLFLLRLLDRMPRPVANLITFTIVVVGWTIFRAHSMDQAFAFLRAMMQPGLPSQTAGVLINPDVTAAGVLAAVICALPRMPGFYRLRHFVFTTPAWTLTMQTALSLVFVLAVGKAVADPFKPFLYFRF